MKRPMQRPRPMQISELINKLRRIRTIEGDLPVASIRDGGLTESYAFDAHDVLVARGHREGGSRRKYRFVNLIFENEPQEGGGVFVVRNDE